MSLTDSISDDLCAMTAGVGAAQRQAAAAEHVIAQIAARAVAAGFAGIAAGLAQVGEVVGRARARLTAIDAILGETTRSVASAAQQPSPQETISALTPLLTVLSRVDAEVAASSGGIEEARRLVTVALRGGQPGPTLARLQQLSQGLSAVKARGNQARHHVEAALAQARQVGDVGKWLRAAAQAGRPLPATAPRTPRAHRTRRSGSLAG